MKPIPFDDAVPVAELMAQRSRSFNPLKEALRQLRDGGKPPTDAETTGQGMTLSNAALETTGAPLTPSRVQQEIVRMNFTEGKAFYAYASSLPGLKGIVRVHLVTREKYEQTPAFKAAQAAGQANAPAANHVSQ